MALTDRAEREAFLEFIKSQKAATEHNHKILCILEGDLLRFVEMEMVKELEGQAFAQAKPRIPPINVLRKIVDKLSRIYQGKVRRSVVDGNEMDAELLAWYEEKFRANEVWNEGNEYFNAFKACLMQPFLDVDEETGIGEPKLRAIPNDRFFVWSTNTVDQTIPTHIALPAGQRLKKVDRGTGQENILVDIFWMWDRDTFIIVDAEGDIDTAAMAKLENDGTNPFGTLPFSYVNKSKNFLVPPIDTDTFRMTTLIPLLLGDLNFAVKFQAFSIFVGINVDDEKLKMNPMAFWSVKQDATREGNASITTIKPEVDIDQVIRLIGTELSMWLQSKNLRPGSMGQGTAENTMSGISKIIDESDASEERLKQVQSFSVAEDEFWNRKIIRMHNHWVDTGQIERTEKFSATAKIVIEFPEQLPMQRRSEVVTTVIAEISAGLKSTETGIREINPDWSDERFEEEMKRIEESSVIEVEVDTGVVSAEGEIPAPGNQPKSEAGVPVKAAQGGLELSQETVLNGAQVTALVEVTQTVAAGTLDKGSAKAILEAAFNLTPERASEIIDPIEVKEQTIEKPQTPQESFNA